MPKRVYFISLLVLFCFSATGFVLALEIRYPSIPGVRTPQEFFKEIKEGTIPKEQALPLYAKYVFYLSLLIAGLAAVGATFFGGIKYLTSFGSVSAMKDARAWISGGVLGFIIIFSSHLILTTINPQLAILAIEKPMPEEPEIPEIPEVEEGVPVYVEIPLGRLIEKVEKENKKANNFTEDIWIAGARQEGKIPLSLKELAHCLKWLTDQCSCLELDTKGCKVANDHCSEGYCQGDPCDFPIMGTLEFYQACPQYAGITQFNVREKIEETKQVMLAKKDELLYYKDLAENQLLVLRQEVTKLILAEALMRDSLYPPTSYDNFIALEEKQVRKINPWQDIDIEDDPATFYIPETGNEELIEIVETLAGEAINPPPWPPPPPPPPPPPDDVIVALDTPTFLQTDPSWKNEYINQCLDKIGVYSPPCESRTGCGCGPTSLAIVLKYFTHLVTPLTISQDVKDGQEYFCGIGSSVYGLANMARDDYEHDHYSISFNNLRDTLEAGHPIIASCRNFANWDSGHITVIRGIGKGYIYFQDTVYGRVAFLKEEVETDFKCWLLYAFKP